ncbi:MAG: DUF6441 family protein [Rhodospirillaceae bacterium]
MAGLNVRFQFDAGALAKALPRMADPIAAAATLAVSEVSDDLKNAARADIGAAGFSRKWQNALRVQVFPKGRRASIDAAGFLYHKIPYSAVFEEGARIRGQPYLWLPLPTVPVGRRGTRLTAANFEARTGQKLVTIKRRSGPPLLGAAISAGPRARNISLAQLRRGRGGRGAVRVVPLFVGVSTATIKKRFHIGQLARQAAGRLPAAYAAALKVQ